MATEAQIYANRENAKASTGPKTEDGKAKAARNNTKFGLFATNNCVQPHEKEDYDHFCDVLWSELAPLGGIEEVTAAEYVRNAWRLRRCAMAEEAVGLWVGRLQAQRNEARGFARPAVDPVIYDECLPTQTAINRARVQAQNGMRRAKADLDKLQATRKSQPQPEATAVESTEDAGPALSENTAHGNSQSNLIRSESEQRYASDGPTIRTQSVQSDPSPESAGPTIRSQSNPLTANPLLKKAA